MTIHEIVGGLMSRREARDTAPVECAYGAPGADASCSIMVTPRASREHGHEGFCSHECAALDQEQAVF